jgi:hypothetical protein
MMSEPGKEPSPELLERIVRLEKEVARIAQINEQVFSSHNDAITELSNGLVSEAETVSHHTDKLYGHVQDLNQEIRHIHGFIEHLLDQLWPLVHKVFPGSAETQQQPDVQTLVGIPEQKRRGGQQCTDMGTTFRPGIPSS